MKIKEMAITADYIEAQNISVGTIFSIVYEDNNYMVEKRLDGYKYYKKDSNGAWVKIEADKISDNVKREVMKEKL